MRQLDICIVEADDSVRQALEQALCDSGHQLRLFHSVELCAMALEQQTPDLLLLPAHSEEALSGLDFCRDLRQGGQHACYIAFIGDGQDVEQRQRCYQAGGDDYLVTTLLPTELNARLRRMVRHEQLQYEKDQQIEMGRSAAFAAMTSLSEMGSVFEYVQRSFRCIDRPGLSNAVFDLLAAYELQGGLQFIASGGHKEIYFSPDSQKELEPAVFDHARKMGRIFQFGERIVFNADRMTLLISNFPEQDTDRCGRLRDHLAIVAECANACSVAIEEEMHKSAQLQLLMTAVDQLAQSIAGIESQRAMSREQIRAVASEYHSELIANCVSMGLEEHQESSLLELAAQVLQKINQLSEQEANQADALKVVLKRLESLLIDG